MAAQNRRRVAPAAPRAGRPRDTLQRRLAEAEQTLDAIRTGAVDAVVVSGPQGPQVYTLQGAERPYRLLLETLNAGALTLTPDGMILYANRQAAVLLGVAGERLTGTAFAAHLTPDDRAAFGALLHRARSVEAAAEFHVLRPGRPLALHLALRSLESPDLHVVCAVLTDLSERKRTEAALRHANESLEARVAERTAGYREAVTHLEEAKRALEQANEALRREVDARRRAAAAVAAEQARGRQQLAEIEAIYHSAAVGLCVFDTELRYRRINERLAESNGVPASEHVGRTVRDVVPDLAAQAEALLRHIVATGEPVLNVEFTGTTQAQPGVPRTWVEQWLPLKDAEGRVIGVNVAAEEITERKRAEAQLRQALVEKDAALATNQTLLREVHHRVKNNLQMICDLLYLQAERLDGGEAQHILQEAYGRIFAITRLHEQLYQSFEGGAIDLSEYLGRLVTGVQSVYSRARFIFHPPATRLLFDVDRAIHVGLLVNELLTNAIKHAFGEDRPGEVVVQVQECGGQLVLEVRDNGRGLPAELDLAQTKSLGLRIVHILAQRLAASVTTQNTTGACFTITFPREAETPREPALA